METCIRPSLMGKDYSSPISFGQELIETETHIISKVTKKRYREGYRIHPISPLRIITAHANISKG
jgi:hypothetical protein